MCMGGPSIPDIPEPTPIATPLDQSVIEEMRDRRRRARLRAGHSGTVLTSGLEEATPTRPSLLGN